MIRNRKNRSTRRAGVLKTEAMLSLFILVIAMNIASPLIHRINLLWMDTQKHQFAINELSNQMDALSNLSAEEVGTAIDSLEVSEAGKKTLGDAKLTGNSTKDELGTRVTLKLSWDERNEGEPIQLSGWIVGEDVVEGDRP